MSQNFRGFKYQAIKEAKDKFLLDVEKLVPSFSDEAWWRNLYRSVGNLIKIDTEENTAQTFLGYGIENPADFTIPTALPPALGESKRWNGVVNCRSFSPRDSNTLSQFLSVRANKALQRVDDIETRTDELETAVDELGTELKQFETRFDENEIIAVEMESAINQFASRLRKIETFTHENGIRLDKSET